MTGEGPKLPCTALTPYLCHPGGRHQDVGGLQIAVDDALEVEIFQSLQYVTEKWPHGCFGEGCSVLRLGCDEQKEEEEEGEWEENSMGGVEVGGRA